MIEPQTNEFQPRPQNATWLPISIEIQASTKQQNCG
jgi:hypothetical protein